MEFLSKNASTYCPKRSTRKAISSTLSSAVQKSITKLREITRAKGKAKENERGQQEMRMEIMEHDGNDDGLEDPSTQDAFLLILKVANLSLKRAQLTQLKIKSQLEMISTNF